MEERRGMESDVKRRDIVNFYIPPDFLPIWEEFKKLTEREGRSYSEVLRALVGAYVTIHRGEHKTTQKKGVESQ